MPTPATAPRILRFASFEANLHAGEVRKNGSLIKVQELPFHALVLLLEHAGQVVTREELRQALWPADIFVDFERGINTTISRLRDSLGDSAVNSRFIQTVGRRGYRFIAPVTAAAPSEVLDLPKATLRATRWLLPTGIAVLVLLATGITLRNRLFPGQIPIRSLAVLPLENLTGNPGNEYLSDGMTDELITDLVKVGGPRVISRTSVMRYKSMKKSLPEIARELSVDAVVEGTVRASNGRIHVTVQLVQAQPERHLWAESYDRPAEDVVALQSELAREIAGAVHISLSPQQHSRIERSVAAEAFRLYLKGRYFWNKRTGEGFKTAIQYFNQAIAEQPDYAAPYAGLADSYLLIGGYYLVPQSESVPKARAAAQKALELDGSLADAHAALGLIAMNYDWQWVEAERQFRQAITLNPNYATAHHWYAEYLATQGRWNESLAEIQVAQELDPLSLIINSDYCKYFYQRRDYDRAVTQCRKTLQLDPNYPLVHIWLAQAYYGKQMFAESIAELEQIRVSDDSGFSLGLLVSAEAAEGRRTQAMKTLLELKRLAERQHVDPAPFIRSYLGLGDNVQTYSWLEKAYTEHSVALTSMKVDPAYDPLRSDPRFIDLMHRVGLAQ